MRVTSFRLAPHDVVRAPDWSGASVQPGSIIRLPVEASVFRRDFSRNKMRYREKPRPIWKKRNRGNILGVSLKFRIADRRRFGFEYQVSFSYIFFLF